MNKKTYFNHIYLIIFTVIAAILCITFLYNWPSALGALAAWITTGSFFLQVVHMIRKRDTTGVSLGMYAALFFGVTTWTFYGYKIHDFPVMVANGITALLALCVILIKLYNEYPKSQKSLKNKAL